MNADTTAPDRRPLSRRAAAWIVSSLVILAIALRVIGLGHQLPHKVEADAVIVHQAAWLERPRLERESGDAQMENFYPYLLAYVLAALPGHSWPQTLAAEEPIERHLAAASEPYLRGRILIACLSLLLIPATYRIARHFLDRGPACFAAALVTTSQLCTFYSQQARPHAAVAALSALAVMLALRHLRVASSWSLAVASLAALAALGSLHNGVFAIPALVCAWWLAPRRRLVAVLLPVIAVALALVLFYPFLFRFGVVAQDQAQKLDIGGQTLTWKQISFDGLHQIFAGLMRFDPVLCVLALLGLCALALVIWRRRREPLPFRAGAFHGTWRELCVAAAFPVCFVAFWAVMKVVWERFNIAILPFLAILAAGACVTVLSRLAPRATRPLSLAAAILVLALPTFVCAQLVWLRAHPDTQTLAARWLERNADPARDVVGMPPLVSLPIWSTRASIEALPVWGRSPWESYQLTLPADATARFTLVPLFTRGDMADKLIDRDEVLRALDRSRCTIAFVQPPAADQPVHDEAREVLRGRVGEPVAAWLPRAADTPPGASWLVQLLAQRHWGPPLEAYRIPDR